MRSFITGLVALTGFFVVMMMAGVRYCSDHIFLDPHFCLDPNNAPRVRFDIFLLVFGTMATIVSSTSAIFLIALRHQVSLPHNPRFSAKSVPIS
jgi:hypothetical protein